MFDSTAVEGITAAAGALAEPLRIELAPEVILPAQLQGGVRNGASLCPEKRLMLAVLEEAVGDYQRHRAAGRTADRLFISTEAWFLSDDTSWPFSFVNICHALGFDVDWMRAGLVRWGETQRARAARGEAVVRLQLRRVAGIRSKATGRATVGRHRSRW